MNTDIRISLDLFSNIKIKRLMRALGHAGLTSLLRLWVYTAQRRSDGVLVGMDPDDIEAAADWDGEPGAFVGTLTAAKLLDHDGVTYVVHDWTVNNPWAAGAARRSEKSRAASNKRWQCHEHATGNATGNATVIATGADSTAEHARGNRPSPSPSPSPSPLQENMSACADEPMPDVPFEAGPYPLTPAEDDLDLEAVFPERSEGVTQEVSRGLAPATKPKKVRRAAAYSPAFEAFWGAYPGGGAKIKAWEQWLAADLEADGDKMAAVLAAVDAQVADRKRTPAGGFYPEWPDAERWIKNQRWTDKLRNQDGPGIVPIATAASSSRESFLAWARQLTSTIGRADDKVRCLVERATVVDGVTVDLDAAHKVLEEQGLDEAWVWVHRATQMGKAQRREVANG